MAKHSSIPNKKNSNKKGNPDDIIDIGAGVVHSKLVTGYNMLNNEDDTRDNLHSQFGAGFSVVTPKNFRSFGMT